MEAVTDREGKQANKMLEKEVVLRHGFFPLNNDNKDYELPSAGSTHTLVTAQAVAEALYFQSCNKGPGLDRISFGSIQPQWM